MYIVDQNEMKYFEFLPIIKFEWSEKSPLENKNRKRNVLFLTEPKEKHFGINTLLTLIFIFLAS